MSLIAVCGGDGGLGAADRSSAPLRPAHGANLAGVAAAAEEPVAAVGLEARQARAGGQFEALQDLAVSRIDPAQFALVGFPGAVPEFAVDPGDAGDEAIGLDGAKDRAGFGIDLMDLAVAVLPDPEGPFGPGQPGVAAAAGRGDGGEHAAGRWIDLLDAILGDLKQMFAVECRPGMRGNLD